MTTERRATLEQLIAAAGLPVPATIEVAKGGSSIAVGFRIRDVIETIEGYGATDGDAVGDVARQFRSIGRGE